jgi:hypothetical protein
MVLLKHLLPQLLQDKDPSLKGPDPVILCLTRGVFLKTSPAVSNHLMADLVHHFSMKFDHANLKFLHQKQIRCQQDYFLIILLSFIISWSL